MHRIRLGASLASADFFQGFLILFVVDIKPVTGIVDRRNELVHGIDLQRGLGKGYIIGYLVQSSGVPGPSG